MNEVFRDLAKENRESYAVDSRQTVTELNIAERSYRGLFISLSTALIAFSSGLLLYNRGFIVLLISGWIMLGISIIFGLIQFFIDIKYFRSQSKSLSEIEAFWREDISNENDYNLAFEKTNLVLSKLEKNSDFKAAIIQGISFFLGLMTISVWTLFVVL